jgi:hypothetical protein
LIRVNALRPRLDDKTAMNEAPLIDSGETKVLSRPDETQSAANGTSSRALTTRVVLLGFAEGQSLCEHAYE